MERWRRRRHPTDPALARYLATFEPLDDAMPLEAVRFVVIDIEATGLDTAKDRILTIGAIPVTATRLQPGEALELTVLQDTVGAEAAPIHGLVRQDVADGVSEPEALGQFVDRLGNAVLVAHHVAFDQGILDAALERHGGAPLLNDVVDTEVLTRRLALGPLPRETTERFTLDASAERYALETEARHTAPGDALLTAELLLRLLVDARRAGLRRLRDLLR